MMRRLAKYIYELPDWPQFHWDVALVSKDLAAVRLKQGRIIGQMQGLGFPQQSESMLRAVTDEVVKSSEIEGEVLNPDQVRSSVARRLGIDIAGLLPSDRRVDGVVKMAIEATQNFRLPLTRERLFQWHADLFPEAPPHMRVGNWRDDAKGPMQVVSGPIERERVHFEAPPAAQVDREMTAFLNWVNRDQAADGALDGVLRAAQAHLWFVTIHPFDDGNGRIARAIADWALARSENSSRRYYSLSAQIRRERNDYYEILERAQKGSLDITEWMRWFLGCLDRAISGAESSLGVVFRKDRFWKTFGSLPLNDRQRLILNQLLDGSFVGKLTSGKWAKLAKCSQDTAYRDIVELVERGILVKDSSGGRSTSYSLKANL